LFAALIFTWLLLLFFHPNEELRRVTADASAVMGYRFNQGTNPTRSV